LSETNWVNTYLVGALINVGTEFDFFVSLNRLSVLEVLDQQILLFFFQLDCHQEEPVLSKLVAGALHQIYTEVKLDFGRAQGQATSLAT
jgi:hypothetical protein